MTNIITEAINAVGASGADWRVQAGAGVLLVLAGIGGLVAWKIKDRKKQGKK